MMMNELDGDVRSLLVLTGSDSVGECLAYIEGEREAMRQLHDENQAVQIYGVRLGVVVDRCMRALEAVESEAGLMMSPRLRERVASVRTEFDGMSASLKELKKLSSAAEKK